MPVLHKEAGGQAMREVQQDVVRQLLPEGDWEA